MKSKLSIVVAAAVLAVIGAVFLFGHPAVAQQAKAPEIEAKDYGSWRVQCAKGAKGQSCNMFQRIVLGDGKDNANAIVLMASVMIARDGNKSMPHLILIAPLGAWLPSGLALKLDDEEQVTVPFARCLPTGCMSDIGISPEFLTKMKNGKTLLVAYKLTADKQNTMGVSLVGFTAGYNALDKKG